MPQDSRTIEENRKWYREKLQDPRWRKLRSVVLERERYICQGCGVHKKNLDVHHGYYESGLEPWEYPTDSLWCLCRSCHEIADRVRVERMRFIGRVHPFSKNPATTQVDSPPRKAAPPHKAAQKQPASKYKPMASAAAGICYCCGSCSGSVAVSYSRSTASKKTWVKNPARVRTRILCQRCFEKLCAVTRSEKQTRNWFNCTHSAYVKRLQCAIQEQVDLAPHLEALGDDFKTVTREFVRVVTQAYEGQGKVGRRTEGP